MTKNTEEAIQQVLKALRDSEAPAGMERRILEALEDRASVKSASKAQWLRSLWLTERPARWRAAAWGAALAATMASCVAVLMIHRTQPLPVRSDIHPAPVTELSPVIAEKPSPRPRPVAAPQWRTKLPAHKPGFVSNDADSLAMRETRAASRPEPPLPLTDQEKLLLRIARGYSPEELAVLDPAKGAALDAKERAEFEKFFDHQRTGDSE